ncbi:class I SAM-dependent methyltransferase [Actinoplanes sp. NPDC049599]|uniref:class I SAM-dependent methyltransferase n=1 Tax=Actinoplanes sp. NPDC049599 TaxID=3363903 RepID=UPI0037884E41
MSRVFGEVAALYDDIRLGYPGELLETLVAYHGGVPAPVADVGAGTGKATELLLELGVPVIAVEPDPRMAAVLAQKFPGVETVTAAFEEWTPPPGGVGLISCATAWHWFDPRTRVQRVRAALQPRGTLAIFHHRHGYADPVQQRTIDAIHQAIDPAQTVDDRPVDWARTDLEHSGLFTDIEVHEWHWHPVFSTEQYLRLLQTFSTFRLRSPAAQRRTVTGLSAAIDGWGGSLRMDIHTVLVVGRAAA